MSISSALESESVFRFTVWLQKTQGLTGFELGLNGSGQGIMIFLKMSPRNHNNYFVTNFVTKSLLTGLNLPMSPFFVTTWIISINSWGGGVHSREVWVEVCRQGLQTLTLFKTKIAHFATLFKTRGTTFWPWFVLFCIQNYTIFYTTIVK